MKTGFNILNNEEDEDNSHLNILSLLTVFMENSISNAAIYTKHSGRKIITSNDISLSLKREVFEFLNSDNLESRAKKILDEYMNELEDSYEDYEEDDEEEDENNKDYSTEETEEFIESTCNCIICSQINKYKILWNEWKPSNKIEEILYNGIIKIDNNFNLNKNI